MLTIKDDQPATVIKVWQGHYIGDLD